MADEKEAVMPWHNPKYNKTDEELAAANAKIGGDPAPEIEKPDKPKTIMKDGKKLYYRSDEDYNDIWDSFLTNESEQFEEFMGYGAEEIQKIGIVKFIDAFDWPNALSVDSYRTVDMFHIVPCVHCGDDFGNVESDFGLCTKCMELYDLEYFEKVMMAAQMEVIEAYKQRGLDNAPNTKSAAITQFMSDKEFREKFLKTVLDERDELRKTIKEGLS